MTEIVIGGDMEDIPEGTYPAKLAGITTKNSVKFDNDFRVWTFVLDNGSIVEGSSSLSTNSKSKGGRWIAALLGRVPQKGESVDVSGKPCLVQVIDKDGWPAVGAVLPPMAGTAFRVVVGDNGTVVSDDRKPSPAPQVEEPSAVPAALPELP